MKLGFGFRYLGRSTVRGFGSLGRNTVRRFWWRAVRRSRWSMTVIVLVMMSVTVSVFSFLPRHPESAYTGVSFGSRIHQRVLIVVVLFRLGGRSIFQIIGGEIGIVIAGEEVFQLEAGILSRARRQLDEGDGSCQQHPARSLVKNIKII